MVELICSVSVFSEPSYTCLGVEFQTVMFAAIWNLDLLECADENKMWTVIWQANIASPSLMAYAWCNEQWYLWFYAVAVKHSLTALYKQKLQLVFKPCICLVLSVFFCLLTTINIWILIYICIHIVFVMKSKIKCITFLSLLFNKE